MIIWHVHGRAAGTAGASESKYMKIRIHISMAGAAGAAGALPGVAAKVLLRLHRARVRACSTTAVCAYCGRPLQVLAGCCGTA